MNEQQQWRNLQVLQEKRTTSAAKDAEDTRRSQWLQQPRLSRDASAAAASADDGSQASAHTAQNLHDKQRQQQQEQQLQLRQHREEQRVGQLQEAEDSALSNTLFYDSLCSADLLQSARGGPGFLDQRKAAAVTEPTGTTAAAGRVPLSFEKQPATASSSAEAEFADPQACPFLPVEKLQRDTYESATTAATEEAFGTTWNSSGNASSSTNRIESNNSNTSTSYLHRLPEETCAGPPNSGHTTSTSLASRTAVPGANITVKSGRSGPSGGGFLHRHNTAAVVGTSCAGGDLENSPVTPAAASGAAEPPRAAARSSSAATNRGHVPSGASTAAGPHSARTTFTAPSSAVRTAGLTAAAKKATIASSSVSAAAVDSAGPSSRCWASTGRATRSSVLRAAAAAARVLQQHQIAEANKLPQQQYVGKTYLERQQISGVACRSVASKWKSAALSPVAAPPAVTAAAAPAAVTGEGTAAAGLPTRAPTELASGGGDKKVCQLLPTDAAAGTADASRRPQRVAAGAKLTETAGATASAAVGNVAAAAVARPVIGPAFFSFPTGRRAPVALLPAGDKNAVLHSNAAASSGCSSPAAGRSRKRAAATGTESSSARGSAAAAAGQRPHTAGATSTASTRDSVTAAAAAVANQIHTTAAPAEGAANAYCLFKATTPAAAAPATRFDSSAQTLVGRCTAPGNRFSAATGKSGGAHSSTAAAAASAAVATAMSKTQAPPTPTARPATGTAATSGALGAGGRARPTAATTATAPVFDGRTGAAAAGRGRPATAPAAAARGLSEGRGTGLLRGRGGPSAAVVDGNTESSVVCRSASSSSARIREKAASAAASILSGRQRSGLDAAGRSSSNSRAGAGSWQRQNGGRALQTQVPHKEQRFCEQKDRLQQQGRHRQQQQVPQQTQQQTDGSLLAGLKNGVKGFVSYIFSSSRSAAGPEHPPDVATTSFLQPSSTKLASAPPDASVGACRPNHMGERAAHPAETNRKATSSAVTEAATAPNAGRATATAAPEGTTLDRTANMSTGRTALQGMNETGGSPLQERLLQRPHLGERSSQQLQTVPQQRQERPPLQQQQENSLVHHGRKLQQQHHQRGVHQPKQRPRDHPAGQETGERHAPRQQKQQQEESHRSGLREPRRCGSNTPQQTQRQQQQQRLRHQQTQNWQAEQVQEGSHLIEDAVSSQRHKRARFTGEEYSPIISRAAAAAAQADDMPACRTREAHGTRGLFPAAMTGAAAPLNTAACAGRKILLQQQQQLEQQQHGKRRQQQTQIESTVGRSICRSPRLLHEARHLQEGRGNKDAGGTESLPFYDALPAAQEAAASAPCASPRAGGALPATLQGAIAATAVSLQTTTKRQQQQAPAAAEATVELGETVYYDNCDEANVVLRPSVFATSAAELFLQAAAGTPLHSKDSSNTSNSNNGSNTNSSSNSSSSFSSRSVTTCGRPEGVTLVSKSNAYGRHKLQQQHQMQEAQQQHGAGPQQQQLSYASSSSGLLRNCFKRLLPDVAASVFTSCSPHTSAACSFSPPPNPPLCERAAATDARRSAASVPEESRPSTHNDIIRSRPAAAVGSRAAVLRSFCMPAAAAADYANPTAEGMARGHAAASRSVATATPSAPVGESTSLLTQLAAAQAFKQAARAAAAAASSAAAAQPFELDAAGDTTVFDSSSAAVITPPAAATSVRSAALPSAAAASSRGIVPIPATALIGDALRTAACAHQGVAAASLPAPLGIAPAAAASEEPAALVTGLGTTTPADLHIVREANIACVRHSLRPHAAGAPAGSGPAASAGEEYTFISSLYSSSRKASGSGNGTTSNHRGNRDYHSASSHEPVSSNNFVGSSSANLLRRRSSSSTLNINSSRISCVTADGDVSCLDNASGEPALEAGKSEAFLQRQQEQQQRQQLEAQQRGGEQQRRRSRDATAAPTAISDALLHTLSERSLCASTREDRSSNNGSREVTSCGVIDAGRSPLGSDALVARGEAAAAAAAEPEAAGATAEVSGKTAAAVTIGRPAPLASTPAAAAPAADPQGISRTRAAPAGREAAAEAGGDCAVALATVGALASPAAEAKTELLSPSGLTVADSLSYSRRSGDSSYRDPQQQRISLPGQQRTSPLTLQYQDSRTQQQHQQRQASPLQQRSPLHQQRHRQVARLQQKQQRASMKKKEQQQLLRQKHQQQRFSPLRSTPPVPAAAAAPLPPRRQVARATLFSLHSSPASPPAAAGAAATAAASGGARLPASAVGQGTATDARAEPEAAAATTLAAAGGALAIGAPREAQVQEEADAGPTSATQASKHEWLQVQRPDSSRRLSRNGGAPTGEVASPSASSAVLSAATAAVPTDAAAPAAAFTAAGTPAAAVFVSSDVPAAEATHSPTAAIRMPSAVCAAATGAAVTGSGSTRAPGGEGPAHAAPGDGGFLAFAGATPPRRRPREEQQQTDGEFCAERQQQYRSGSAYAFQNQHLLLQERMPLVARRQTTPRGGSPLRYSEFLKTQRRKEAGAAQGEVAPAAGARTAAAAATGGGGGGLRTAAGGATAADATATAGRGDEAAATSPGASGGEKQPASLLQQRPSLLGQQTFAGISNACSPGSLSFSSWRRSPAGERAEAQLLLVDSQRKRRKFYKLQV